MPAILKNTHQVLEVELTVINLQENDLFTANNPWHHFFRLTTENTYRSLTEEFALYEKINYATKTPKGMDNPLPTNEARIIKIYFAIEKEYDINEYTICLWSKLITEKSPELGNPVLDANWYCVELE